MAVFSLPRRRLFLGGTAMAGLLMSRVAQAAALSVDPIMVAFRPGRTTATLRITNRGGAATAAQIRLFAWSQEGDQDVLAPTADVLASPPMFEVKPGEEQVIRLVLRRPAEALERTYRLILDEIPPVGRGREVVVALRLSLPVIVTGSRPAEPELAWRAARGPGNRILLLARNTGSRHVRVNQLEALLPRGAMTAQPVSSNPYILSGMERRWQLPSNAAGSADRLRLRIQAGTGASTETTIALPG